ncbi:MAG: Rpn family recombination-promoting nuclease/putative transposase [Anaerolineales bacterium]|nr:Rpn family recombination-promoting nuclease/putative transposase [Anaerolineales bacterium]
MRRPPVAVRRTAWRTGQRCCGAGLMVRIWEAGQKQKPPAPLAPILPIVVYHGLAPWREPLNMGGLFPGPAAMRPHWPTFTYQLVDLSQVPEKAAAGMLHLEAALWALRNSHREDVVDHLAELLSLLAELTLIYGAVQYSITILHYVSSVHKDVDAVTIRQALRDASVDAGEKLMATWLDERYEAGKEIGEQKGRTEEARRIALNFLQHRFGPLDATLAARVNSLELEQLEALTTATFDAKKLADIMPLLEQ